MVEWRNLKLLHQNDRARIAKLEAENKQLKTENAALQQQLASTTETLTARIEELETMVFGRRQRFRSGGQREPASKSRDTASYHRSMPQDIPVTNEEHMGITACRHCGGPLTDIQEYVRYEEDIILAALSQFARFRTLTKQTIERGYCAHCGKYSSARDLRGQSVTIGPVVRAFVCYLITVADHTYAQVMQLLWDIYRFTITEGEIAAILQERSTLLLPEYERLKEVIRAGPAVHLDESKWRIQSEGGSGYAWSMSATGSTDVVYRLAEGRGKSNAEELVGQNYHGIGITDRYGGYKHLFETVNDDGSATNRHQVCWAHVQRNAKDLTHLTCLPKAKLQHVTVFYKQLAAIYATIREIQEKPFLQAQRQAQAAVLLKQVTTLCQPHSLDLKKLAVLKAGILEYQASLFLCLTVDGIPADNNRAERDIKKLVIKRKKSLGCKTTKGAHALEILLSVAWSLYSRDREQFFPAFIALTAQSAN